LAYCPYADVIWCETPHPDLDEARRFAEGIHVKFPGKLLTYNCSPSFNWKKHLEHKQISQFQIKLGEMGYKYQFVTMAGFHALNATMFELAREYSTRGMSAYVRLQEREFELAEQGYTAVRHQRFVGIGYFDAVQTTITGGHSSIGALAGSTAAEQFAAGVAVTP
jgi:isocitrate lyase